MSSVFWNKEPRRRNIVPPPGGAARGEGLLQAVLVGLDHFLDHLSADGTGLLAGQVAVIALLQVHADLP